MKAIGKFLRKIFRKRKYSFVCERVFSTKGKNGETHLIFHPDIIKGVIKFEVKYYGDNFKRCTFYDDFKDAANEYKTDCKLVNL